MQAYLTSWMPDLGHDRSHEKMACTKPRTMNFMDASYLKSLKRKRTNSFVEVLSPKKRKEEVNHAVANREIVPQPTLPLQTSHVEATSDESPSSRQQDDSLAPSKAPVELELSTAEPPAAPTMDSRSTRRERARQQIEHQINLEVLLKHKELRLIEQELAKCQVSLEQLRRCHVIPYPGETGSVPSRLQVSTGTGPSVTPAPDLSRPPYAAPWGVTDGPYTRHYARWLIPDSQFDPTSLNGPSPFGGRPYFGSDARSTRGSYSERSSFGAPRHQRTSTGFNLPSLAGNFPAPVKDRHAPLIVKRQSDGQFVKLVCKFCNKDNISSVQGFLNHCRIAHEKNYESHNAAVEDCCQPLDGNEASAVASPATPAAAEQASSCFGSASVISPATGRPSVHPLITTSQAPRPDLVSALPNTPATPSSPASQSSKLPNVGEGPFVASRSTPQLSALMQKRGITGDLSKLVSSAKQRLDMSQIVPLHDGESDDDIDSKSTPSKPHSKPKSGIPASRVPTTQAPGQKSVNGGRTMPVPNSSSEPSTPYSSTSQNFPRVPSQLCYETKPQDLNILDASDENADAPAWSPSITADTNPGLVTDRDDDDDADFEVKSDSDDQHFSEPELRVRVRQDGDDRMDIDDPHEAGSDANPKQLDHMSGTESVSTTPEKRKRGRPSKRGGSSKGSTPMKK